MADVRLGRHEPAEAVVLCGRAESLGEGCDLDRVADGGARAVRLEQGDVARGQAGTCERFLYDVGVAVDAGREIAHLAGAVVVDRTSLDDREDRVTVSVCVGETAQRDDACSAGEHRAAREFIERAAHAVGRQDLAFVVPVAATVRNLDGDASGDGHVGLEGEQALYREVDRDEGGRAGGLHVDRRAAKVEAVRHAGGEEVFVVRRVAQQEPAHLIDELRVRQQVVHEIGVHAAAGEHTDRAVEALGYVTGRLDRLPGDLIEVPVLGIHDGCIPCADAEERGVEVIDAREYTGALDVIGRLHQRRWETSGEQRLGIEVDEAVVAVTHAGPQRIGIGRAGESARHANDGDVGFGQVVSVHAVRVLDRCDAAVRTAHSPPRRLSARRLIAPRSVALGTADTPVSGPSPTSAPAAVVADVARCAAKARMVG